MASEHFQIRFINPISSVNAGPRSQGCLCETSATAPMRHLLLALLALADVMMLSSCASSSPVGPVHGLDDNHGFTSSLLAKLVDHEKDDWNPLGLWRRVQSAPPAYIPVGTPKELSLTAENGTWFVDAADGWRFFVPQDGVPGYPEGLLLGEARKITNTRTPGENTRRNIGRCFFGTLLLPAIGLCSGD